MSAQLDSHDSLDLTVEEPRETPDPPAAVRPRGSSVIGGPAQAVVADAEAPAAIDATPGTEDTPVRKAPSRLKRVGRWLRGHLLALVAALVVLALVVALVLTTLALRREHAVDDARVSALKAGQESAVALASYDYRTLDKDFGAVTDRSTPAFRDSFAQTSGALRQVLEQYSATAKSTVAAAGVTSATTKRAVVLVFVNQEATNTNQKSGPTTDQSRVEITLVRPGKTWLIDAVKLL